MNNSTTTYFIKKHSLILFTILSIILNSCGNSNEEKAKDAIRTYLNENLDDMSSYEPVKFGTLDSLISIDLTGTTLADGNQKKLPTELEMFHSYRLKEKDGSKYLVKEYFKLNSKLEVISSRKLSYNFRFNGVSSLDLDINRMPEDTAAAEE